MTSASAGAKTTTNASTRANGRWKRTKTTMDVRTKRRIHDDFERRRGRDGRTRAVARETRVAAANSANAAAILERLEDDTTTTNSGRTMPVQLLTGYAQVIDALCDELRRTSAGDEVDFSVYVFERGESSKRVIDAMISAVQRGARVRCTVDGSPVSKFTRWCEGSTTLTRELEALEVVLGRERFAFDAVSQATHAKFMIIQRTRALPTAIFGGVNVGDRFANWRDFAIRAEGHEVVRALRASLAAAASGRGAELDGVRFITNLPTGFSLLAWTFPRYINFPGVFNVRPAMMRLLEDESYSRYRIAMAYIDSVGADMLDSMLARGNTSLTLVVPRTPNVYHDANRKALNRLVQRNAKRNNGDSSNLNVVMLDEMLHAKVFFAESDDSSIPDVAMLGSCNLKQRSLGQFVELNAEIRQPILTRALREELDQIINESLPSVDEDLEYAEPKATIEEWLG